MFKWAVYIVTWIKYTIFDQFMQEPQVNSKGLLLLFPTTVQSTERE